MTEEIRCSDEICAKVHIVSPPCACLSAASALSFYKSLLKNTTSYTVIGHTVWTMQKEGHTSYGVGDERLLTTMVNFAFSKAKDEKTTGTRFGKGDWILVSKRCSK